MQDKITPGLGYIFGQEVKEEAGAVTASEVSDTHQRYEILAMGDPDLRALEVFSGLPGSVASKKYERNFPGCKVGDVVIIQKHAAEGDTPPEMLSKGFALFLASRVMAVVGK
jgi:hypothetical protein